MELLFDVGIKSILITGIGLLLTILLKHQSAHLRHWLISCTLISLLILPIAAYFLPNWEVVPLPEESAIANLYKASTISISHNDNPIEKNAPIEVFPPQHLLNESNTDELSQHYFSIVVIFWGLVALIFIIRLIGGIIALNRLTNSAIPIPQIALPFSASSKVLVKESNRIDTPMTWGFFRPVILIPQFDQNLEGEQLETILVHEHAHIERKDFLLHLLTLLAGCLYWFNPLYWVLKKRQTLEREKACDELVLSKGWHPTDYASQLVSIARTISQQPQPLIREMAIPLGGISQIKQRVRAILSFDIKTILPSALQLRSYAGYFGCLIPIIAAISPINPSESIPYLKELKEDMKVVELPKLPFLEIKSTDAKSPSRIILKSKREPIRVEPLSTISPPEIAMPSRPLLITKPSIPLKQVQEVTGLKGTWTNGNTHYKFWTYGKVTPSTSEPYFHFETLDAMVIIEESKKGSWKKSKKLLLTPAPFNGVLVQDFLGGVPNAFSGYRAGEILPFWYKNGEWVFRFNAHKKWLQSVGPQIVKRMMDGDVITASNKDQQWQQIIDSHQAIKKKRFVLPPKHSVVTDLFSSIDSSVAVLPTQVVSVPTPKITGTTKVLGRNNPTKTTTGFGGSNGVGKIFGSVIPYQGPSVQVDAFHFHVRYKRYDTVNLALNFYKLAHGKVLGLLHATPFNATVALLDGWNQIDLPESTLFMDSDILVTMEIIGSQPTHGGMFLSWDKEPYREPIPLSGLNIGGIQETNFSFYLTVRE